MCKNKARKLIKIAKNYNIAYNELTGSDNFHNISPFILGGLCLIGGIIFKNMFLIILAVLILFWGFYTYIQPLLYKHRILKKIIQTTMFCCIPFVTFYNGILLSKVYFIQTTDKHSMFLLAFSAIFSSLMVGILTTKDAINHIGKINEEKSYVSFLLLEIFQIINFFAVFYTLIFIIDHNGITGINTTNAFTIYLDMVYFSTVTFTTLGYGDIVPINPFAKVTVILEVFLFVIVISLIVVNMSKHRSAKEDSIEGDTREEQIGDKPTS